MLLSSCGDFYYDSYYHYPPDIEIRFSERPRFHRPPPRRMPIQPDKPLRK